MKQEHSDSHSHHIVPIKTYAGVLVLLMILMGLTIGAYYFDFSHLLGEVPGTFVNNIVAMTIAMTKASIVIAIFMGVKYATKLTKLYAYLGFVWVTLLGITLCDYSTRHLEPESGWEGYKQSPITNMNLPAVDKEAVKRAHVIGEEGHGEAAEH